MDIQKHGFWIALGVVLLLELGFLFVMVLPADGEVTKMQDAIKGNLNQLKQWQSKPAIPNNQNIQQAQKQRAGAVRNLLRGVIHLAAQDDAALEGREKGGGGDAVDTPEAIGPVFRDKWGKLEQALKSGKGAYVGLRLKQRVDDAGNPVKAAIVWPNLPTEQDEVPEFYRKWWTMQMLLDRVLAPVSKKAYDASTDKTPWGLYEISWMDGEEGGRETYVHQYLQIKVVLQMRLTDLNKLMAGVLNTRFLLIPHSLQVRQAAPDPAVIPIPVPFGKKAPSKEKQKEMASKLRPLVEVELVVRVADLDAKKLLDIGRRFKKFLGPNPKKAMGAFIEDLKGDKEFLKGVGDKDKFLDKMQAELLKKP